MTAEEIKQSISMRELVERYGYQPNRAGFIHCPFHKGDKGASMKIYKDSFHCFGCGANGDIFTFIQMYDNCDFKTAFYQLGGTYQKDDRASKLAIYKAQKAKEKRAKQEQREKEKIMRNNTMIHASRELFKQAEPLSDDWWDYLDMYHTAIINDINWKGEN